PGVATRGYPRQVEDERHVHWLPGEGAVVSPVPVLVELLPVVAGHEHDGVVEDATACECVEHRADQAVRVVHRVPIAVVDAQPALALAQAAKADPGGVRPI